MIWYDTIYVSFFEMHTIIPYIVCGYMHMQ